MDIGAVFLVLAVVLLVGLFVGQPLMERRARRVADEEHEISALMAERDRVINALQELDFDHALGKIPAEDYPAQRAALLQKGADILRHLDTYPSPTRAERSADEAEGVGSDGMSAEERLESAVAARRADASAQPASALDDDEIEAMIAARRKARKAKSGGFCPKCGKPVLASDRFCPNCGKAIR